MKPWWVLFLCVMGMGVLLAAALLAPELPGGHGTPHPTRQAMLRGGDGQRHADLLLAGWAYGSLQLVLFVTALWVCLPPARGARAVLLGVGALYLAAFSLIFLAYRSELAPGGGAEVFGFPASTALMLLVLWPVPLLFIVAYVAGFHSWVLPPESQEKFAALCRRERGE